MSAKVELSDTTPIPVSDNTARNQH